MKKNTKAPSVKSQPEESKPLAPEEKKIFKNIFWALACIALIAMAWMSFDAGNSGDEHFHHKHAGDVYNYYMSGGKDTVAVTMTEQNNLPSYGQVVDNIAYFVERIFGIDNYMGARHLINSIFGWLALLFAALIAFRISKEWKAAILVLILMFFSPRFLGHSFNNLKDLPLATTIIMGIYFIIAFFQEFPKVKVSTMIGLGVSIGLSIAVRIGGLLLIPYFGLFGVLYLWQTYKLKTFPVAQQKKNFTRLLIMGVAISLAGFVFALLLWPYALQSPIKNTFGTLSEMSSFAISIRQNFEGVMQWSDNLPWYYTPKFIFITIPIAVILGALVFMFTDWTKQNRIEKIFILFCFIFPIFWITYTGANVYGGWRHSIFAYPPMVVCAGLGFNTLINKLTAYLLSKKAGLKPELVYGLGFLAVLLLLFGPIRHTFKNHPYEYVYFNALIGGIDGAYGHYELDYYYHSTRAATEWVIANAEKTGLETEGKIKVASWHPASVDYYLRNDTAKFQGAFTRWYDRGNNDWDYAIFTITGISPALLRNADAFPPVNTVHQIKVDDKPICIILKRTDKSDYYGNIYKSRNQTDSAMMLLKHSLEVVPTDESVLLNLAEIYLNRGQFDSADIYLNALLSYDELNENAYYLRAYSRMYQNRLDEAQKDLQFIINYNHKNSSAAWLSANIYASQGNLIMMEKMLEKFLTQSPQQQQQAYDFLKQVYSKVGLSTDDANRAFNRIWTKVLENLGYKN